MSGSGTEFLEKSGLFAKRGISLVAPRKETTTSVIQQAHQSLSESKTLLRHIDDNQAHISQLRTAVRSSTTQLLESAQALSEINLRLSELETQLASAEDSDKAKQVEKMLQLIKHSQAKFQQAQTHLQKLRNKNLVSEVKETPTETSHILKNCQTSIQFAQVLKNAPSLDELHRQLMANTIQAIEKHRTQLSSARSELLSEIQQLSNTVSRMQVDLDKHEKFISLPASSHSETVVQMPNAAERFFRQPSAKSNFFSTPKQRPLSASVLTFTPSTTTAPRK